MKRFLRQLLHKWSAYLGDTLLVISCLNDMGMSPNQANAFIGAVQPGQEEAAYWAGLARLKNREEVGQRW